MSTSEKKGNETSEDTYTGNEPDPNDPGKRIPTKEDNDNDATKPNPGHIDPQKPDPMRIEEPPQINPARIDNR
jgi:hypothetical protein